MITIYDIGEEDGTHFITDLSLPSLRAGAGREMGRGEPPETRRFKRTLPPIIKSPGEPVLFQKRRTTPKSGPCSLA